MVQNVVLNLKSPQAIKTDIAFTQGDYGEAKLSIMVKDNDVYVSGDEGANIAFLRADSNIVTGNLIGANGLYTYTFEGNELECAGNVVATVTINYPNGRVSAAAFCFNVRYNPAYDKKIPAGPYIVELEKIKEQAQSYVDYLQELISMLQPDIGSTALTKADLINGFDQTAAGLKALDAAAAKTLKDLIDGKIATSQIVNNLLATVPGNVLDATQGKTLGDRLTAAEGEIDQLNSEIGNPISNISFKYNISSLEDLKTKFSSAFSQLKEAQFIEFSFSTSVAFSPLNGGSFEVHMSKLLKVGDGYGYATLFSYSTAGVKKLTMSCDNGVWSNPVAY